MNPVSQLNTALTGRYEIEREIGAGGMATVYLARDVKHERHVALKVLKPELGAVLGVERFLSEIRVTANLQHPNLLPLFDSGEADGLLFYVMPFVEGETLRARLAREKQLPVDEAVRIASAIASALEYAHTHHVIHRDLKPENILIQGGQPVIADFGIALAVSNAGGARITQTGLSLGTPQYMSPEQATGDRQIDARTDIYSLAAVTYEMLVGDPPHLGSTAQAIIAKVLTERPPNVRVARASVPEHVAYAIEKGLEKLPADRWRTAAEFEAAVTGRTGPAEGSAMYRTITHTPSTASRSRFARFFATPVIGGSLGVLSVVCAAGWWIATHRVAAVSAVRLTLENPAGAQASASGGEFAISPDGQTVAFIAEHPDGKRELFIRTLDNVTPRELTGADNAAMPFFSPDGRWVGFVADQQLKKIPVEGGSVVTLAEISDAIGASWGRKGFIAVSTGGHIALVPENGGATRLMPGADPATERYPRYPLFLPDAETVLYTSWGGQASDARLVARSVRTGAITELGVVGVAVVGVLDGFLLYAGGAGSLLAVPFDERAIRITPDSSQQLVDGISISRSGRLSIALSENGSLVYQTGSVLTEAVLVDLRGGVRLLSGDQKFFDYPRFSPDGRTVAFGIDGRSSTDVWLYDVSSGSPARLTVAGTVNTRPEWSRDGKRVLYRSNRDGTSALWWQPVDGSGPPEMLLRSQGRDVWEGLLSPTDETVLYRTGTLGSADIWFRRLNGDTTTKPFAATPFTEYEARFSRDGNWIAYSSDERGTRQVFVKRFPSGDGRYQVSTDGGEQPVWSTDGRRLYYVRRSGQLLSARIHTAPAFAVIGVDTVTRGGYYLTMRLGHAGYDVAPDGEHVLLLRPVSTEVPTIVVSGWLDEWRTQRAAAKRK